MKPNKEIEDSMLDKLLIDNREAGENLTKQCQLVILRMFKVFDYLCKKHNVDYFLIGGSLLGAIRHQGFIPWDDDLDIGMTRDNYELFVNNVVSEIPESIFFQNHNTDKRFPEDDYVDAKLRDKYSRYTKDKYEYHDGLQVDIFVYDKAFFETTYSTVIQNYLLNKLNRLVPRSKMLNYITTYSPFKHVYSSNYLQRWGQVKFGQNFIKEEEFKTLVETQFEDTTAFIPKGWHECLKRQYGDYMVWPSVEKRITHHAELPDPFNPCNHEEILYWKK